jgi:hypothetical protein
MANILSNSGIVNGQQITVNEITQIIDVFTAAIPSDVTFKGEFFPTGSTTKIIASNGFIGSLFGTASVATSSSVSLTGPLTYNSASYALTSSVLVPLKTNTFTDSFGYTTNVTTGLISGYGEITAGNSSSVITGLTELIGKEMDTTGRSGSVFISMFQNNSSGNNFDPNKVIAPYALSSSNLTFQTLGRNSVAESVSFNYIITYV